eukprot:GFKZ01002468.1.p1 GENE.GFKZ01002468.1~~GFKZ01002468.1.p1  ORF type:complete len:352 (+),score=18.79 GFKZ01002468.1:71-1057(+)
MSTVFLFLALLLPSLIISTPPNVTHIPPTIIQNTLHRSIHINPVSRQGRVPPCGRSCRFRLCNFNGATRVLPPASFVILNDINQAALPYVCLADQQAIGQVQSATPARIVSNGRLIPLPRFNPSGLNAAFAGNLFRTSTIPFMPFSGISRRPTTGNQWQFLHDQCLTLPIRRYRLLNGPDFTPGRRVNAGRSARNCVAFRTTAATIQVQLTWDSNDDFDVRVTEPDGDTVAFFNTRTEAGRLVGDNNVGFCDSRLIAGRENVLYFPGGPIETGRYSVQVRHFNVCNPGTTTNWRLVVVINGETVLRRTGQAGRGGNQVVTNARFRFSG